MGSALHCPSKGALLGGYVQPGSHVKILWVGQQAAIPMFWQRSTCHERCQSICESFNYSLRIRLPTPKASCVPSKQECAQKIQNADCAKVEAAATLV